MTSISRLPERRPLKDPGRVQLLTIIALLSSLGPALRAHRVDPMIALRE